MQGFILSIAAITAWVGLISGTSFAMAAHYPVPQYLHGGPILLEDITVIDGLGREPQTGLDVLINDGVIAAITPHGEIATPEKTLIINGNGKTVMPGLIDGHSHLLVNPAKGDPAAFHTLDIWRPLPANLYAGVTTIADMGSALAPATDLRDALAQGRLAGPLVHTVGDYFEEGSERTHYMAPHRLERLEDYITLLDQHHEKGIRLIKAYVTMPLVRLSVLTSEAQKRGMSVVADSFAWLGSSAYVRAGVAGFAHVPITHPLEPAEIDVLKENNIWLIGTLAIAGQPSADTNRALSDGTDFLDDPMVANFYLEDEIEAMRSPDYATALVDGFVAEAAKAYGDRFMSNIDEYQAIGIQNVKALLDAGVLVGLGTDPLFPGMFHGEAMHYEMNVWSRAGIDNLAIIQAATHSNARILQIEDQTGSIQPGLRADLLVVEGNPADRIQDTRNVHAVIQAGKLVDREALVFVEQN